MPISMVSVQTTVNVHRIRDFLEFLANLKNDAGSAKIRRVGDKYNEYFGAVVLSNHSCNLFRF